MNDTFDLPEHYTECFEKNTRWMAFFETNNLPHFIASSSVATFLNSTTIYHLLSFNELESMVAILDGDINTRLYIAALFAKENYELPYMELFTGDLKYQHYRTWRLFFSCFLKQHACDVALIHFIMTTIDHVFEWANFCEINIALTLLYEWMIKAKIYGHDIKLCQQGVGFAAFIHGVARALFDTTDSHIVARELCKRFWLTFDGAHSFETFIEHIDIWSGTRCFYTDTLHRLPSQFTCAVIENNMLFI